MPRQAVARGWWTRCLAATLLAAATATAVDAVLLQARRSYFTGGFLAVDYLQSTLEAIAFVASSLVSDAAILALPVALMMWLAARAGLRSGVAVVGSAAIALVPIGVADLIEYEIASYLGDAFDLALLFDLAGRSPGEILAVSSEHLGQWLLPMIVLACLAAGTVWLVRRYGRSSGSGQLPPRVRRVLAWSLAMFVLGVAVSTVARAQSAALDNGLRRKASGQVLGAVANMASDVDGDGFGILGRPPDPDLFDGRVQPYGLDVPGNGIDENGIGGDLPAGATPIVEEVGAVGAWARRPDVVLIVLESFRADALGASVNGKPVTPVLSRLAADGVSARAAYSHNGYTIQSRYHILSGSVAGLAADSIVDDFNANGYETAYFSAQDESYGEPRDRAGFRRAAHAYDARVDRARRYSTFSTPGSLAVSHTVLNARIGEFLRARREERRDERPLFLYANFHDTHFPYHHRDIAPLVSSTVVAQGDIAPSRAGALREMYLNTAANVDRAIGELLSQVRQALGREPGVIVLSDHGESLYDEEFLGHGYVLNEVQTRIPLVVHNLPLAVEEPFGQADLRGLLRRALGETDAPSAPTLRRDPAKRVFQYLGAIERPASIAFVTADRRVTLDLRSRRIDFGSGESRSIDELTGDERRTYLDLVHTWERMLLAGPRGGTSTETR